jgi:hypothetical protein
MGLYDPTTGKWTKVTVRRESVEAQKENKAFISHVFRRSLHRPRTPAGGTYMSPYPQAGSRVATVVYACVPNWQLFWMADALAAQKAVPTNYLLLGGIYVLLVIGFFGLLAVVLFWNREVGGAMRV